MPALEQFLHSAVRPLGADELMLPTAVKRIEHFGMTGYNRLIDVRRRDNGSVAAALTVTDPLAVKSHHVRYCGMPNASHAAEHALRDANR